ncbi:MAG: hypothetical protein D6721_00500 [Gammaproteobacteria bacterium]|nr:MAG: hypothetical protein D6721_00500 [Gammaproteobacteria bacterium]
MYLQHKPIPGYWYTNIVGQLLQVRMLLYRGTHLVRIQVEYANGRREGLTPGDWYRLDLALHSPRRVRWDRIHDL